MTQRRVVWKSEEGVLMGEKMEGAKRKKGLELEEGETRVLGGRCLRWQRALDLM